MKFMILICLVLFFDGISALNEACTTNNNCTFKEKTVCINNTCQCDQLSYFSDDLTKCLTYATEYKKLCYEDKQCTDFLEENSFCFNYFCLCKPPHRWYQGKCQKYANKGEHCDDGVPCLDGTTPLALQCKDNTCQCSDGYYDRGDDCRLKSELDKDCAITSDCFPTTNKFGILSYSHCELGKCVQNQVKYYTQEEFNNTFQYTTKISYLQQLLDETLKDETITEIIKKCPNVQPDLSQQECLDCDHTMFFKKSTCICKQGYFLLNGQCIAELGMDTLEGGKYLNDSECPIKPGKAVNGTCYCRNYWFQDATNRECKKTTLQYTDNCLDNDWCKAMGPYAYCDSDTQKCQCISQAVLNETSFYCHLNPDANLTNICLDSTSCSLYETCQKERCVCDEGFFKVNETSPCLPKIGSSCEVRNCNHIDSAVCSEDEICQCDGDLVTNGFLCLKATEELEEECLIEEQCVNIPHSDCQKSSELSDGASRCLCVDEFTNVKGSCYANKTPGSQCTTQFDCTIILGESFECRNNLCQCPIGKTLNSDNVCGTTSSSNTIFYSWLLVFLLTNLLFWI